jgi:hypothetical protein
MAGIIGRLNLMTVTPFSAASQAEFPPPRRASVTQVVTPESPAAYRAAVRNVRGVPVDRSTLRQQTDEGHTFPGWVGLSTAMVVPTTHGWRESRGQ